MKSLLFFSLITFNLNQAKADYTKVIDLKMNCDAEAIITKTFGTTYHPEVPAKGRFPGIPAFTVADVEIQFIAFSPACDDLVETYNLILPKVIETTMTYGEKAISFEQGLINLTLQQEMPSVQNLLPLYPDFHLEKLSLVGKNGLKVNLPYNFQEQYDSYNLTQAKNFTDEVKLQLTEKILKASLDLYEGKNGFDKNYFGDNYQSTIYDKYLPEINDGTLLKKQAKLYIAYLEKLKALSPNASYFSFNVGGAGGQVIGAIISSMIAEGAIDNTKALDLVKNYPALLLFTGSDNCPLASSADLIEFLNYVKAEKKTAHKYNDAVQSLTSGWYSSCGKLETPEINALASQILVELF
jgi:hypothetical protein